MVKSVKLKFPVIKGALPPARILSMEEYLRFVTFNLKYTVDKKAVRRQKRSEAVKAPFVL